MRLSRHKLRLALVCAPSLAFLATACNDFDTSRVTPSRGTTGEELFGVICDRVGAQALREDLTGASVHGVCHKDASGNYADAVDESVLPPPSDDLKDTHGNPVSIDDQTRNRAYALARIGALVRDRSALIEAFDAMFPEVQLPVKDLHNADATKSCDPAQGDQALRTLGKELSDLLGRLTPLYDDGTIPSSTESLGRIASNFQATPDAQNALAHLSARNGYRPLAIALGLIRPIMAYNGFRDFSAQSLRIFSSDSDPFNPNPQYDANGHRIQTPGSAYAQLSALMEAMHEELRTSTADPLLPTLGVTPDAKIGRDVLSRPRSNLEVMRELFYASDPTYNNGSKSPSYIVRRDARGVAVVPLVSGKIPAPFVDKDGDGLADLDASGSFVTTDGNPAPSPFLSLDLSPTDPTPRDSFGRAMVGGQLPYAYLDTSHLFSAQLITDMKPLVDPSQDHNHETMMNAVGGAWVLLGDRDPAATKVFPPDPNAVANWTLTHDASEPPPAALGTAPVTVTYNGYKTDTSSMLDLVYALGNVLGDPTTDDTLAYTRKLMTDDLPATTRVAGAALAWKATSDTHPEAANAHAPKSLFWDDLMAVVVQIAKVPGLLEDVLRALGDDSLLGTADNVPLGAMYANYMKYGDHISYNRDQLNGPAINLTTGNVEEMHTPVDRSKPQTGFNQSSFARFLRAIYDTDGVTACNRAGAVLHAKGTPLGSMDIYSDGPSIFPFNGSKPFKECEVFKIPDLATFYLDSTIGKAHLNFRPSVVWNGVDLGVTHLGASSVDVIEQSSGIGLNANDFDGFWDPTSTTKNFRPRPQYLNRLVMFDVEHDTKNANTRKFLQDLQGTYVGCTDPATCGVGSRVCPERVIPDPCQGKVGGSCVQNDVDADGMVHGLRSCQDGDWLYQRDQDATMVWEDFGFYKAMTPMVTAFANHNAEGLLVKALDVIYQHWNDATATTQDCSDDPKDPRYCAKDALNTYEPLLSETFGGDMLPALHDLEKILETVTVPKCTAFDPKTKLCTTTTNQDGITTLAETTRTLFDEDRARTIDLRDRLGHSYGVKNDGTHTAQVTPIYLLTNALDNMDAAFDAYNAAHPLDIARQAKWRSARSQLVDQFLKVNGSGTTSVFANQAFTKFTPTLIDVVRAQLYANCPASFAPPYPRCEWARTDLTKKMTTTVGGPEFAGLMDVLDAISADQGARVATENLLTYLLDQASSNDAQASVLASMSDMLQVLDDDTNLVPIYHVLSEATGASLRDEKGNVIQSSAVDSTLALLSQIAAYARDKDGNEICSREIDPNQVLNIALKNMVTPLPSAPGAPPRKTPIEVVLDVITDVNRVAPDQTSKLVAPDYANIASNVQSFLVDKQSGLEQFYAIVRNGTE